MYMFRVQDFCLFRSLFSLSRTPAKGKYHFKGPPCLLTLKCAKEDCFSGRRMGPVTRSDVVSGPFEVQGRVRRSDMRVCLLAVTGHWLHLLSLEAFEKGRGGRYGDITRLFEMFCQKQKKKGCETSSLFKNVLSSCVSLHTLARSGTQCYQLSMLTVTDMYIFEACAFLTQKNALLFCLIFLSYLGLGYSHFRL